MIVLIGTLGLVTFSALAWVVLLASVSALHSLFDEAVDQRNGFDDDETAAVLGLPWWMVWFHFLLLIVVTVCAVMGVLKHHTQTLGNFFAALFALQMWNTHLAKILSQEAENTISKIENRTNTFLAGCILTSFATALLIIWLGAVSYINDGPVPWMSGSSGKKPDQAPPAPPPPPPAPVPATQPAGPPAPFSVATGTGSSYASAPAQVPMHDPAYAGAPPPVPMHDPNAYHQATPNNQPPHAPPAGATAYDSVQY